MEICTSAESKKAIVALACGSRSISRVFLFRWAIAAARLMAVVVFPTPPFWLATVRMAVITCPALLRGRALRPQVPTDFFPARRETISPLRDTLGAQIRCELGMPTNSGGTYFRRMWV